MENVKRKKRDQERRKNRNGNERLKRNQNTGKKRKMNMKKVMMQEKEKEMKEAAIIDSMNGRRGEERKMFEFTKSEKDKEKENDLEDTFSHRVSE